MKVVGGIGFKKTYTKEQWADIERQREEMRHRLTAPDGCSCEICRNFKEKLAKAP
jgi:hypothetical protein